MTSEEAIWHDLECGRYEADLPLWLELARSFGDPVLDIGAGTGRVALALAQAGYDVVAVEQDQQLARELQRRADGLTVDVVCGDACALALGAGLFPLSVVPMQTIHLLGDRAGFFAGVRQALAPGGVLAIALLGAGVEDFESELDADELEIGGVLYASRPTALRSGSYGVLLERRRERVSAEGTTVGFDQQLLAALDAELLCEEAAGFEALPSLFIAETDEYAGSEVVLLRRLP